MKLKQESGCKLFKIYYNFERALCVVVKKKLGKLKKVFKWCGVLHVTCVRFLIIFFFRRFAIKVSGVVLANQVEVNFL